MGWGSFRARVALAISVAVTTIALSACGAGSSHSSAVAPTAVVGTQPVSTPTAARTGATASSGVSTWQTATNQLCAGKRAAVARLGGIHITYAGIAQEGLPKIRKLLDAYLARMLAVDRHFKARQDRISVPVSIRADAAEADRIEASEEASIKQLRFQLGAVGSAAELSAAFNTWLTAGQRLAVTGNALAHKFNLSACLVG